MAGLEVNMAVITQDEVKTLLQISVSTYDDLIDFLIPIIEDSIKAYCNQSFVDAPTLPRWEVWMKLPASEMIGYKLNATVGSFNGMKSESQGGYSYTKSDMINGFPTEIMKAFDSAKMAVIGFAQKRSQYRDGRGLTENQLVKYGFIRGNPNGVIDED